MKGLKLFWTVVKRVHMDKMVYAFLISMLVVAAIIMAAEPEINTYGDALWYTFVACTTIGFGDFAAVTAIGRIATVYIAINEIVMIAVVPGVVVSYYLEVVHRRENEKLMEVLDTLERLPELSKEELKAISEEIKELRG